MPVSPEDLTAFEKKNVIIHVLKDGELVEREGSIQAASVNGIAFKEKGKRDFELILPADIEEIAAAPAPAKKLIQKNIRPITVEGARQHLFTMHGWDRKTASEAEPEKAFELHAQIDHSQLGHKHTEPKSAESNDSDDED